MIKNSFKFRSIFLVLGFLIAASNALAADEPKGSGGSDWATKIAALKDKSNEDYYSLASKICSEIKIPGGTGPNGAAAPAVDDARAQAVCARRVTKDLEGRRKLCADKGTECKSEIDQYRAETETDFGLGDSKVEARRKDRCESLYSDDQEIYKECSKVPAQQARSCAKLNSDDGGFMNSDEMQMATPMLGMVSGADTLLGIYSAMNDRPDCNLSKEDFKANEDKLDEQKKDLEQKVKDNMKDAEEAQSDYSKKLKDWADQEGKITDRLSEMPSEKEDSLHKLDNEKVKAKMQADSKYNAIVDQMGDLRRKYNDMVSAKTVAIAENSDFAIHDRCAIVATGGDPSKQGAPASNARQPSQAVQASFAGAFAQGKVTTVNIQKRYESCVKTESLKQKRVESTFASELSAIKAKLSSMDSALGQINEEKRLADQEIIYQMQNIEKNAANEAKKLAAEYQRIQVDKTNEQTLLKQKLERLNSETKKYQQQLAILGMKLSMYKDGKRRPAKFADDKSMKDMLNQCGESYKNILEGFQSDCCKPSAFSGTGSSVCRMTYRDFEKPAPSKKETKKVK